MKQYFYDLADKLTKRCDENQIMLLELSAEDSEFVRFNNSLVRQAGSVTQTYLSMELIEGAKHASESVTLSGDLEADLDRCDVALNTLKKHLPGTADDPYLLYSQDVQNSEQIGTNKLPEISHVVDAILSAGEGRDLVGIFAQGMIAKGFANSLGQRNWFETHSFNFDWCFYSHADKAAKCSYAGFEWDSVEFDLKVTSAIEQSELLKIEPKTIQPGEYKVYLAPAALAELTEMMNWGGFSLKQHKIKSTPLVKMTTEGATLSDKITIRENTAAGLSANFTGSGYIKPDCITLIENGEYKNSLVSPRTAKEYSAEVNTGTESTQSFEIAPGDIPSQKVLDKLGTGIYCNTLWYLNFSDRTAARVTGMTRFATFWVEDGKIVAPLNVMRFDESLYRALGENLIGLTDQCEFIPSASTYAARSTASHRVPGALIDNFKFTL